MKEGDKYADVREGYPIEFRFKFDNHMLIVKPEDDRKGFEAKLLEFISCPSSQSDDIWNDETECQIQFEVCARYDGLRHMWWKGEDDDGYIYYPNAITLSNVFIKLREMEELYCSSHDDK